MGDHCSGDVCRKGSWASQVLVSDVENAKLKVKVMGDLEACADNGQ